MPKYNNELSSSGTSISLNPGSGFVGSTVMGSGSGNTHQFSGSVYISGNLRAWTYKVDSIVSGSTIFGNDPTDTHQFTGSVSTTGSEFTVWTDTGPPATPNFDVGYTWGPGSTTIANASSSISLGYAGHQNLIYITDQAAVIGMGQAAGVSGTILLADGIGAAVGVGLDTVNNKSPGVLSLAATNTLISSSLGTQFTGSVFVVPVSGALGGPGSYVGLDSNNQLILTSSIHSAPGGADTQIQFNNAGAFDGDANLTFNGSTLHFTGVGTQVTSSLVALTDDTSASLYVGAQPWGDPYPGRISLSGSGGVHIQSPDIQITDGVAGVTVASTFGPFGPLVHITDQTASLLVGYPAPGGVAIAATRTIVSGSTFVVTGSTSLSGSTTVLGSTILGSVPSHTHQFTGSLYQSSSFGTLLVGDDGLGTGSFTYQQDGTGSITLTVGAALGAGASALTMDSSEVGPGSYYSTAELSATAVALPGIVTIGTELHLSNPISGSLAGPGSYLGLSNFGKVIVTSSAGGGAGVPGGLDTQIQYNDVGAFTGSANLTFNGSTLHFTGSQIVSGSSNVHGSTTLGSAPSHTHQFTGSVHVTGTAQFNEDVLVLDGKRLQIGASNWITSSGPNATWRGWNTTIQNTTLGTFVVTGSTSLSGSTTVLGSTILGSVPSHTHQFTGSVLANSTITANSLVTTFGGFGNPTTLSASVIIPTDYNYCLVGPLHLSGGVSILISGSGNFKIL